MTKSCVRGCTNYRRHQPNCTDTDHCTGCLPRPAEHGHLCWPCHRRLQLWLTDAPTIHAWLTANLTAGTGTARAKADHERGGGKGARGNDVPAPIKLDLLDTRDLLADRLATWVDDFTQHRHIHAPRAGITQDAALLLRWLPEIETLDWIGDWWTELAETIHDAHTHAPWRPETRRCPGIPCPECGETNLVIHGGETDVTCRSCHTLIPETRYGIWVAMLGEGATA